jgi:hypothetical protein
MFVRPDNLSFYVRNFCDKRKIQIETIERTAFILTLDPLPWCNKTICEPKNPFISAVLDGAFQTEIQLVHVILLGLGNGSRP